MLHQIYLGTVLLERNRWKTRIPSNKISQFSDIIRAAGFDGVGKGID